MACKSSGSRGEKKCFQKRLGENLRKQKENGGRYGGRGGGEDLVDFRRFQVYSFRQIGKNFVFYHSRGGFAECLKEM